MNSLGFNRGRMCLILDGSIGGSGPTAKTTNQTVSGTGKNTSGVFTETGSIGLGRQAQYQESGSFDFSKANLRGASITFVAPAASQTAPPIGTSQGALNPNDSAAASSTTETTGFKFSDIDWHKWGAPLVAILVIAFFVFRRRR